MNVLILGKGFVGNALKEEIPNATLISAKDYPYHDVGMLYSCLKINHIDIVVNCAGYTGVPNVDACEINKEQCFEYNAVLPNIIADACESAGAKLIHISSGCIYDGYSKVYTEEDDPDFGLYSDRSSFYSKSKHAAELLLSNKKQDIAIVRLRIPFDRTPSRKNYFDKLLGYDNLIDFVNSKTDLRYLCRFIHQLTKDFTRGTFNAVHSNALSTKQVIKIMQEYGLNNPNWKIVDYKDIPIKANRSNCVLSNQKVRMWGFNFVDEEQAIREALEIYTKK